MTTMRRTPIAVLGSLALGLALALPAAAPATLNEVGFLPATTPPTVPSCPSSPCLAVSRTTGFQTKVGAVNKPMVVRRTGSLVAWTIMLGKPNATQIKFFNANEGGVAQAGIAVLRAQPKQRLTYKLVAQSPPIALQRYFGTTVELPLETTLAVKKGDIVALTVPTWAPALALGFGHETSWRASRSKAQCASTSTLSTHTRVGSSVQYYCLYQTARLAYSATVISTP
jgi:hypothetical protein